MKLKSTSDDDASLSFNDLENTQNTSAETANKFWKRHRHSNSESEENGNGNASILEYEDADDDEYDDENDDNSSAKLQSPEKSVDDDAKNTSKVDVLRKKSEFIEINCITDKRLQAEKLDIKECSTQYLVQYQSMRLLHSCRDLT